MLLTILAQTVSPTGSATTAAKPTNALVSLLPLILIFGLFYLFMIRPQRQRQRKQAELMGDLEIGDEIQTAAGMFGKIVQLSDEFAWVELAPGTTIKMLRRAVIGKVGPIEEAEPGTAE